MDGNPIPKSKNWKGQLYSETRFAIIQWLEKELPLVSGEIIDIGSGNWKVPRQLTDKAKVTTFKTFDKKVYGNTSNTADFYGDIEQMPKEWSNRWDVVLCLEVMECIPDPFKAMEEIHRIIKPGGILLLSCPFNYRWFGTGSWNDPKQNALGVQDYWRISENGWQLLTKKFKDVKIQNSGPNKWDPFCYMIKAIK